MGLVIFGAMALYLVVTIFVVTGAISHARKNGKSVKRWGWGAALVIYLIPFWDWIPTVAVHQYYCATEAGFWVYKTPEQWKKENPGVTLTEDRVTSGIRVGSDENHTDTISMNQRFDITTEKFRPIIVLSLYRWKNEIVDKEKREPVARRIGFSAGEGRDSNKSWINISECNSGNETLTALRQFSQSIVIVNKGVAK